MPAHREIDSLEARVVGVLVEKELTTPDSYPLSLNALAAGCNQKSNRNPVLSLSEAEVLLVVEGLRTKGIVGASYPSSGRVERFHHSTREIWNLQPAGLAVVTVVDVRSAIQQFVRVEFQAPAVDRLPTHEDVSGYLKNVGGLGVHPEKGVHSCVG